MRLDLVETDVIAPGGAELEHLHRFGFVVVEEVLDAATVAALAERLDALLVAEGPDAGSEFRHLTAVDDRAGTNYLGALHHKDPIFLRCVTAPRVLGFARDLLGDEIAVHAVNARDPRRGGGEQQRHTHPGLCNTLWLIDEMTPDNGPTEVIAGSHLDEDSADARVIVAPAGAVVVLHPMVLHRGTRNRSGAPRRVITTAYSDAGVPAQHLPGRSGD